MAGYIGTTGQAATLAMILTDRDNAKVRATVQVLTTGVRVTTGTTR